MAEKLNNNWVRFMDEMPPIGVEIIIAYSSAPYNGMSWGHVGILIDSDFAIIGFDPKLKIPLYKSQDFDEREAYTKYYSYAHHWAYLTEESKNLYIKTICEYERRMRGECKHPIKV